LPSSKLPNRHTNGSRRISDSEVCCSGSATRANAVILAMVRAG